MQDGAHSCPYSTPQKEYLEQNVAHFSSVMLFVLVPYSCTDVRARAEVESLKQPW